MYRISLQDDISMMPRERLIREGADKTKVIRIAIYIFTNRQQRTVFQVSQRILSS